jgi:cytoskeletal protein CcmA (bactofilin family)
MFCLLRDTRRRRVPWLRLKRAAEEGEVGAAKLGLLAALIVLAPAGVRAQAQAAGPEAAAETTAAPQPQVPRIVVRRGEFSAIDGQVPGLAFVKGPQVRITAQVAGDIFAVSRDLRVEGAKADHFFLAGRELDLAPAAARDIIAAGARIQLRSGEVGDDVVAAGGEISLAPDVKIQGSTVLAARQLRMEGAVGRALMAGGDRVELNGPVAGDARIHAHEIVIGPRARIGGDLHLRGDRIEIAPGAVIQGRTIREAFRPRQPPARLALPAILFALGALIMVGLVATALPELMERVDGRLRSRFWATLGIGVLILLFALPVIVVLLATVLGAPLALLLAFAYFLAMPLAFAGVSYSIGEFIRGRLARGRPAASPSRAARAGWTVLTALAIILLGMIPLLGALIWLLVEAAGLGALAVQLVPRRGEAVPASA